MAGRVQIEALGQLSDFLTVEPSFSFFTKRYSKYTNHANENYKISYPMRVYTDDFLDVRIPQNCGDILQEVTLSFTMDSAKIAELGSNISPIDVFGISTIEYVDLYVGDQKIDTVTSDDIFIDRELNIPESYRSSIDVIHGKHFQGSSDREFLQEFYDGQFSTQGTDQFDANEYRIQIPFYFHHRPAYGFPLCALRKQELSLRIKIRQTNDLLFVSQEKFGDNLWDPRANNQVTDPIELCNFKVNLGVVHLDMVERCMLQNKPIDIHFEQRQRNTFLIDAQSKVGNFRLDFKNCVKELYFIAKKTGKWTDENISILDQLRELDGYTSEQQTTLTILKLIPVWGGIMGNALDTLVGETDTTVRTELIDTVLNLFYWGTDDTYTSVLEALKTPSEDDLTRVTTIKTYINSIPSIILGIQTEATNLLNSLIPLTDQGDTPTRIGIVQQLLDIENLWGPEQIGILNALQYPEILRPPEVPSDDLLIFGLRVYLTTASYYLPGLSQLKPGTPEQVATVNKVTEIFDNTKAEYDIIKIGVKAVLDDIPGKTAYIRSRIIYATIKIGTFDIGSTRSIWTEVHLEQLNSLTVDPGSNPDDIATQRATIDSLIGYLNSLDDVKGYINTQLTLLDGELNYDTRDDIVNNLINLLNLTTPGPFWGETEFVYLFALKNSDLAYAGTGTEDDRISDLRIYTDSQIVFDSVGRKTLIDNTLDLLDGQTVQGTRESIVNGLLAIPDYWNSDTILLLNALKDSGTPLGGTPTEDEYISILRVYMNVLVYGLRLITEGMVGATGIEYTIDRLLTLLAGETDVPTRIDLVNGLLAIPGVWRQTELGILDALNTPSLPNEADLILALRLQSNTISFNIAAGIIPAGFPGATLEERIANVQVLRITPVWEDTIIKLVNVWTFGGATTTTLVNYLQGNIGAIPILKFRLNVLKAGINGILDDLPSTAVERDPIILGITTLHTWSDTQFYFLNELRTPSGADLIYINALKISTGSLDSLTTDPVGRPTIVGGLLSIPNFWTSEQTALITALFNPANDATTIPALNALVTPVPIMTGYTQFDQNNVIDGILSQTIWGSYYFNLNELRQIEPGFVGQATVISELGVYISALPSSYGYIVDGIDTTLDSLPGLGEQRTGIIGGLLGLQNIWSQPQIDILTEMLTSSDNDATNIPTLTGYIDGVINVYDTAVGYLEPANTILASEVDTLKGYPFWGVDQVAVLTQLEALVDTRGPSGTVSDSEIYFKGILDLYTRGIRFYWNLVEDGVATTVSGIATVSNSTERDILVGLLINFPIWGAAQLALLRELRTVDSKNHVDAIDAIVGYLDTVSAAIYNPSVPSGLLIDLQTPGITSTDLIDTDLKKAVWGGYFYYLLEALQNPAIITGTEAGIITKLSTHVNISQSSESRTNNLNLLIRQLLNTYPETIFNKWVRAKKNVPLMYSKLKYVKLECDGVQILDEITGSNMFLSASLPNLYHKRSPNFRNINIYSFALYPQDLQPSGHLNFSTVKDANLYMELQYDGAHGTYDFDDNYISLFGIDPIYFPKQVIIIAKSYNMMIIRDGVARIIF